MTICLEIIFQQIRFFVLCRGDDVLHFCIINNEQRQRSEADRKLFDQILKLFMRLYTGNRRDANEHRAFFLPKCTGGFSRHFI